MEERISPIVESKTFEQLGILVLDGSGSMSTKGETSQTKAEEVNHAVRNLISRLRNSSLKENFWLAAITYDHRVNRVRLIPKPVLEVDATEGYNPMVGHGGETAIGDALEAAGDVAHEFLAGQTELPRYTVILLMTDGQNTHGRDPITVAEKLKASGDRITICAAGYGRAGDLDETTLRRLVSKEGGYKHTLNAEDLRDFFVESFAVRG